MIDKNLAVTFPQGFLIGQKNGFDTDVTMNEKA